MRQLEEVTFRRTTISVNELCNYADVYFQKAMRKVSSQISFATQSIDRVVLGDLVQLHFLLENLINEALSVQENGEIKLEVVDAVDGFISFRFTDSRREKSVDELNQLFYPKLHKADSDHVGQLIGAEYLICKQIIRDHEIGSASCRERE